MAERITRLEIADKAIVHTDLPVRRPMTVDRSFELPTGLYAAMAALFFGFVAVMAIGFGAPGMVVPTGIIRPVRWWSRMPSSGQRANTDSASSSMPFRVSGA